MAGVKAGAQINGGDQAPVEAGEGVVAPVFRLVLPGVVALLQQLFVALPGAGHPDDDIHAHRDEGQQQADREHAGQLGFQRHAEKQRHHAQDAQHDAHHQTLVVDGGKGLPFGFHNARHPVFRGDGLLFQKFIPLQLDAAGQQNGHPRRHDHEQKQQADGGGHVLAEGDAAVFRHAGDGNQRHRRQDEQRHRQRDEFVAAPAQLQIKVGLLQRDGPGRGAFLRQQGGGAALLFGGVVLQQVIGAYPEQLAHL